MIKDTPWIVYEDLYTAMIVARVNDGQFEAYTQCGKPFYFTTTYDAQQKADWLNLHEHKQRIREALEIEDKRNRTSWL